MTNLPRENHFKQYGDRRDLKSLPDDNVLGQRCLIIAFPGKYTAPATSDVPAPSSMGAAALTLSAALDCAVFPVPVGTKKSHIAGAKKGGVRWGASKDHEVLRGYWEKWPNANIGVPCGAEAGFFVVEIDTKIGHGVDGAKSLLDLQAANTKLPETLMAMSPSGSIHYYFEVPEDAVKVYNSAGALGAGIDVRGTGGMCVGVPSVRDGVAYHWVNEGVPIAKAPKWLRDLVTHDKAKTLTSESFSKYGKDNERTTYAEDLKNLTEAAFRDQELSITQKMANDHVPLDKMMERFLAATKALKKRKKLQWNLDSKDHIEKLRLICQSAINKVKDEEEEADKRSSPAGIREDIAHNRRPTIRIVAGGLSDAATFGADALIGAGIQIYHRGDDLVRPVVEETQAARNRKTMVARLVVVSPAQMRDQLDLVAHWEKYSATAGGFVPANVPEEVATRIMSRIGTWPFLKVAGIISTPTMRHDGTILSDEGFDDATKLLLLTPPPMPAIPERPTRSDALEALATLEELLVEFPFVGDVDRAVALSALITPVVRAAFLVAPIHVADAPAPASGKSYLYDCVSAISTGQRMPVISKGASEEELEKRLGAELMSGQSLICIDNVNGELKGDALCQIVERSIVHIRILGKSEKVTIETRSTTMYCDGNNITIVGDLCRRAIKTTLDPKVERPELREFKGDPVARILDNRGKYIAACLIICRAYIVAGRPDKAKRLASYEDWSDTVRSSLMWLGKADAVASMDQMRADDPELNELSNVVDAWVQVFGSGWEHRLTLDQVVEKLKSGESKWARLCSVLEGAARVGKEPISPRCLAMWLRSKKGRIVGGQHFDSKDAGDRAGKVWWVAGERPKPPKPRDAVKSEKLSVALKAGRSAARRKAQ